MRTRFILVIILNLLVYLEQIKAGLRTINDRVEALEVSKESKMKMLTLHISPSNTSYVQSELQVTQDLVSSKLKINATVIRCLVREAPDTCEYLINLRPPNFCMAVNAENMAWTSMTGAYTPKFRCPLKKGKYVAEKITIDGNKWTIFPLEKWYFKLNMTLYEGDVLTLAVIFDVHFVRVH